MAEAQEITVFFPVHAETIWEGYAGTQDHLLLPFVSLLDVQGDSGLLRYKSPDLTNAIHFHAAVYSTSHQEH